MNEVKKNLSKWMYWFILAVAVILVYKFLDNISQIGNVIGNFFEVITPFLAGTLLAYLLYIPASRIEKSFVKSRSKLLKKKARGISVLLTYILAILVIILVVNVILPVVTESVIDLVNNFQNYWEVAVKKLNALPEDSILKSPQVIEIIKSVGESLKDIDFTQYISSEKITDQNIINKYIIFHII